MDYIKNNLISITAILISLASFSISLKNHIKSRVRLKLSSKNDKNLCIGFMYYEEYKIITVDLTVENNSTSAVNITNIKLKTKNETYVASTINFSDNYNENGLTLLNADNEHYLPINITSENILNKTRIDSYGVLHGLAVFKNINLIDSPQNYKLVLKTPSKSFSTSVIVNPCPVGYAPIHPLKN